MQLHPPISRLLSQWQTINPIARRLIFIRFLRSIAQGALAVDFVLYLKDLHWPASHIGLLLMATGIVASILSIVVGIASDHQGRKPFILGYEVLLILGTLTFLAIPTTPVLVVVAVVLGFGRGANGSAGPFGPAEQAWLAQSIATRDRGSVFSLNATSGFWGMAIGSILASVLPSFFSSIGPNQYFSLFWLTAIIGVINLIQVHRTPNDSPPSISESSATNPSSESREEPTIKRSENRALRALVFVNMINGLGVSFIAPLFPYWFSIRYGVGYGAIGSLFGLTFFLTGVASLYAGWLSKRMGLVDTIVKIRIIGVVLLVMLPFMPSFPLAAMVYLLRSLVNRGTFGARQAFSVGLVRDQRRGLASSLNAISWNIPSAIGPAIGGWLLSVGSLSLPFYFAAALQFLYLVAFRRLFAAQRTEREPANPQTPHK